MITQKSVERTIEMVGNSDIGETPAEGGVLPWTTKYPSTNTYKNPRRSLAWIHYLVSVHKVRYLRYACSKNSHLRNVNSNFSSCASLDNKLSKSDTEFIDRLYLVTQTVHNTNYFRPILFVSQAHYVFFSSHNRNFRISEIFSISSNQNSTISLYCTVILQSIFKIRKTRG